MRNLRQQALISSTSWRVEPIKMSGKSPQLELQQDTLTNQIQKPCWLKLQMRLKFATWKKSWLWVQKVRQIWLSRSRRQIRDTCRAGVKSRTCYRMILPHAGFKRQKSKRWGLTSEPSEGTMLTRVLQRYQIQKRNTSDAPLIHKLPRQRNGKRKVEDSLQVSPDLRVKVLAVWIQ